jgi:hypothetical protein
VLTRLDFELSSKNLLKFRNPFAIANYLNHPPKGGQPNVFCHGYDFPEHM